MCLDFYYSFVDRVKEALTEYGVNAGTLTEERVSAILKDFYKRIDLTVCFLFFYLFYFFRCLK
jgi:hypothetical protein